MDAFTFLKKIKKRPAAGGPSSGSASDGPGRGGIGGRFSLFPHGPPHTIDILFADPPYHGPLAERFLRHLGKSDMITKRTIVIIEHFHKMPLPEETDGLNLVRRYRYGDTVLSIYKRDSQDKLGGDFATVERV
jgi:16S rRNA G966 N2-methylase RsmD